MSSKAKSLGDRMKGYYEGRTRQFLIRRMPTIIRLDGKNFSTYTRGLKKPFDEGLIEDMKATTKFLCENIEGVVCGYTQSDEITLVLIDYKKLDSEMWFDGNVQKIVSISASMATAKFNELRIERAAYSETALSHGLSIDEYKPRLAFFDSRVFQIPEKEEVVNCLLFRQRDTERNSIQMLSQSLFSHGTKNSEMYKKNTSELQEMCFQKGHNWNDLHYSKKRGSFITKNLYVNDKRMFIYRRDSEWISNQDDSKPIDGDLWFQKNNRSQFEECADDRGRLLMYYVNPNPEEFDGWVDIPIEKIRTKWEFIETPFFGKDRNSILDLI